MIPKITGFAGDLFVPSKQYLKLTGGYSDRPELKVLATIADLFLVHDNVSIRADTWTLQELYGCFTKNELAEMLENKRISFYLPLYQNGYKLDWLNHIEKHFSKFPKHALKENISGKIIAKQISDNLLQPTVTDNKFSIFENEIKDLFYNHGIQRDSFFTTDVQIGFNQAIDKIRELWNCGLLSTTFDEEVLYYLDVCDKASFLRESELSSPVLNSGSGQMIDKLHSYKNCPSLIKVLMASSDPTKKMIDIVNSHEASDLRKWLQENIEKNVDVRDVYETTLSKLPSKNEWIDWLRFGGVSVVTSIMGTMLTSDPTLGLLIGTAGGAIDKIYGSSAIDKTMEQYNPETWFGFMKNQTT